MNWLKVQKIVFIGFIILIVFSLVSYYIWGDEITMKEIQDVLKPFGIWAPLIFLIIFIFGTIFIPSTPLMALSGILFGFKFGFLYSMIGGTISALISFYIGRKLGKNWVENILDYRYMKKLSNYNQKLEKGAIWDTIIFRNIPIMPFNALNILLSVSRIKWQDYIIGTVIGLIPSNLISVYLGIIFAKIF